MIETIETLQNYMKKFLAILDAIIMCAITLGTYA